MSNAVLGFDLRTADASASAAAVFRTEVEPGTETIFGWKLRQIGAQFAKDGLNAEGFEAGDEGEISAEDAFKMVMQIEAGLGWLGGTGRGSRPIRPIVALSIKCFETLLDFLIAFSDELLVVAVGGQGLFEREDMFETIVADQAFGDRFD